MDHLAINDIVALMTVSKAFYHLTRISPSGAATTQALSTLAAASAIPQLLSRNFQIQR